ncbi:MAG: glutamyl-tRNA reductase [Candidatus Omnitrophica bacterium CG11_big_fil_rev_8_21_14_0_20_42_13]|uniref:Glutamyl-tRNA reductase n=1 Tax=Candidatus Ghiorseimicrobium undicola TaxID=1974746 RepID=A0A2H0LYP4_9BACT|nr:MAG: glutamyl-tRNA reductase [Candidatus Omnitrophica bacterium CG11_big_fil_rev_8_21_14_0_20_42_13]
MRLVVTGINHKTAPVEIRERLSFSIKETVEANRLFKKNLAVSEGLILSTCNRMEIYAVLNNHDGDYIAKLTSFLSEFRDIDSRQFKDRLYIHEGKAAIEHLFRVAAGLDSMVIGEMEILGQVKQAYYDAQESRTTGKILNRLFQKTFNTAKKIRTDTFITRGSVSVSSVAVKLAEKILGDLSDKKVLIVGAGQIGEQLLVYLKKNGVKAILVANRTFEKALALADRFAASAIKFDDFINSLIDADIVISSTGAPHNIIRKEDVAHIMPKRRQKPFFIIDLAVPRDVEAEVNKIDNVYLYDIDDLQKIVDGNLALRKNELSNCDKIIESASAHFENWLVKENIKHHEG